MTSSGTIYLFNGMNGDLYYFTLKYGNPQTTKINLIPVKRLSDGTCGLFDTVAKRFYTNGAKNSGASKSTKTYINGSGETLSGYVWN